MENMNLTFVNVGYGEAILVSCPDASAPDGVFTMLIDGGSGLPEEYQNQPSGRLPVTEFVRRSGLGHLDAMVSTHIHEDHLCGLAALPDTLMPKVLWQSLPLDFCRRVMHPLPERGGTVSRNNFLRSLNDALPLMERVCAAGGSVEDLGAGMERTLCSGLTLRVLSPAPEARRELMERMEALYAPQPEEAFFRKLDALDARMNNFSLMLLLDYRGTRVLLPGDTNVAGYGHVDPADLRADIFKVGHHGQKDGADEALLRAVRPKAVVCCASSDRRYNSAHPDLMRTIAAGGAALYFSDCPSLPEEMEPAPPHGALTFTLEPEGVFTACYEPPAMEG